MAESKKRNLVVAQLSGGNDYLNCVIPHNDPLYQDYRKHVRIEQDKMIPLDADYSLNPAMQPIKDLFDQGKVEMIM